MLIHYITLMLLLISMGCRSMDVRRAKHEERFNKKMPQNVSILELLRVPW